MKGQLYTGDSEVFLFCYTVVCLSLTDYLLTELSVEVENRDQLSDAVYDAAVNSGLNQPYVLVAVNDVGCCVGAWSLHTSYHKQEMSFLRFERTKHQ